MKMLKLDTVLYVCPAYPDMTIGNVLPHTHTQSNNAGELQGVIAALRACDTITARLRQSVIPQIYTDSVYVIQAISSHLHDWKSGWLERPSVISVSNEPNAVLLHTLGTLCRGRTVILQHVRAHTSNNDYASFHNRAVDKIANHTTITPTNRLD
jgi:ribonuclease HI